MKKLLTILILSVLSVFFTTSIAGATAYYSLGDTNNYWPGWENTDTHSPPDNERDYIGSPDFSGGMAEVNGGYLEKLTIYQVLTVTDPILSPGDLFIDVNNDTTWDFVVDLTSWTKPSNVSVENPDPSAGNYNVYRINLDLGHGGSSIDNPGYILSGKDNSTGTFGGYDWNWTGHNMRDDHPIAASEIVWTTWETNFEGATVPVVGHPNYVGYLEQVHFSGWYDTLNTQYIFDFAHDLIAVNEPFKIGWGTNCANDVIYETANPVPEPATLLLLGTGLLGLAGIGRKKFRKS